MTELFYFIKTENTKLLSIPFLNGMSIGGYLLSIFVVAIIINLIVDFIRKKK